MASVKLNNTLKFAQSAMTKLKKIEKVVDKKKIVISGVYPTKQEQTSTDLPANPSLNTLLNIKQSNSKVSAHVSPCVLCNLEKEDIYVQYTDVLVLRQFLKDDGTVLSRAVTGLCKEQQKKVNVLVKYAKEAGLIKCGTEGSNDPKKLNRYFDKYELLKRTRKYLWNKTSSINKQTNKSHISIHIIRQQQQIFQIQ